MPLVFLPEKILRQKATEIKLPLSKTDQKMCEEMIAFLTNESDDKQERQGVGIAAPQLNYNKRAFFVSFTDENNNHFQELLINPVLIGHSITKDAALKNGEGCLSIDAESDLEGLVVRYFKVIIKGYSFFQKKEVEITENGHLAIILQHELDHLNGVLYIDHINKKDPWLLNKELTLI